MGAAIISTVTGQGKSAETYARWALEIHACAVCGDDKTSTTRGSRRSRPVYRADTDDSTIPMARHRASTPSIPPSRMQGSRWAKVDEVVPSVKSR
ncbi:hypothetical protein THAOC_29827 [Thalassiosira oceanica]|uniref:Uncharacterized protein n=1 Tax=Thalassiosira oceanica TaxID=159749 RepID=K0RFI7_THAOC|nr:hypothetical protein THAOC_29827 [Thalassiosira oceanica]|eukprot:EJK51039.1 hypothetical protein THAOC_29827 [Thalassiosira oceanica]